VILFGHQTGNPNSHHAALAHFERGRLEAFVVPWFPGSASLALLKQFPPTSTMAMRLMRRRFEPLAGVRFIQGRPGEFRRLLQRAAGVGDESLCYEVNDWLMQTMKRNLRGKSVTAIHGPEDASLWQFEEAKKLGKACIYDMPIGYYPWWDDKQKALAKEYADWVPVGGLPANRYVRPAQKVKEMELADVVLVACGFVERTIREFLPQKRIAIAPYGVDAEFWCPGKAGEQGAGSGEHGVEPRLGEMAPRQSKERGAGSGERSEGSLLAASDSRPVTPPLRFIYAGQSSIRKGIPMLIEAWEKAQLRDAELLLVGSWQLAVDKLKKFPSGVRFIGPVGPEKLRDLYRASDAFVFPSYFEGFGLVLLEAMACGLPVIASNRSAGPDVLDESCGRVIEAGNQEQLVGTMRWFGANREQLPQMKKASRRRAEAFTWANYRRSVSGAVEPFL
jgi:glycosyltransferase involved in cell wall biosynthesis